MDRRKSNYLLPFLLVWYLNCFAASAADNRLRHKSGVNPIRKVVTLLQNMQKKVSEEGEKAEQLFEKYVCYCKKNEEELSKSIEISKVRISALESNIKASTSKKTQLEKNIEAHTADRISAENAMAEATELRKKDQSSRESTINDSRTNIKDIGRALNALRSGSFLQAPVVTSLKSFFSSERGALSDSDRELVLSFLSEVEGTNGGSEVENGGSEVANVGGEVTGILDQLKVDMQKDLSEMIDDERQASQQYEALMKAKNTEKALLTKSIEDKLNRKATVGVEIATLKTDYEDTVEAFNEDTGYLAVLRKNCEDKVRVHQEEKELRSQEVLAIAETIKVLNDDDALDTFKSTLPNPSLLQTADTRLSFLQISEAGVNPRAAAQKVLVGMRARRPGSRNQVKMNFIEAALRGSQQGFGSVIEMVDRLTGTLQSEQIADDNKKEYCQKESDRADDQKKQKEQRYADVQTVIEEAKEAKSAIEEELANLKKSLSDLDASVKEATQIRQEEHASFKELMAADSAAKEILQIAKNRLHKFYNKALHKPNMKRGQAGEFLQVTRRERGAPPVPPETAAAYSKKMEESGGATAMIDILLGDLQKEMVTSDTHEKRNQQAYEETMADSNIKRQEDSKMLANKVAAEAAMSTSLQESHADLQSVNKSLNSLLEYIRTVHADCDWLVANHGNRKEARSDELDGLQRAKAALSGADYSFLQVASSSMLRKFRRKP